MWWPLATQACSRKIWKPTLWSCGSKDFVKCECPTWFLSSGLAGIAQNQFSIFSNILHSRWPSRFICEEWPHSAINPNITWNSTSYKDHANCTTGSHNAKRYILLQGNMRWRSETTELWLVTQHCQTHFSFNAWHNPRATTNVPNVWTQSNIREVYNEQTCRLPLFSGQLVTETRHTF
jgi:hypothetical protein